MTLNNLILLYINGDKFNKAEPLIHEAMFSNRSQKDKQSIFLSEAEMEIYIYFMTISNYVYESTFLNQITLKPSLSEEVYNIELLTKGMLLNSNLKMRSDILSSNDTSLINLYNRWISVKTYLANQYMISADKRSPDLEQLEVNANYMEKELLKTSKEFSGSKQQEDAIWTDIKSSLKEKEASVEFASFNYYDGKRWTDSVYYIALVLKKDDKYPKMIYLCEEKQLDSVFNFTKGNDRAKADQLYASRGIKVKDDGATNKTYSKLYNLIWKPISESLKEVETIYFSPTGLLNKISFAAIANPDSVYLSDKYRLVQLSSTAEILRLKQKNVQISVSDTAIIYGGINYEKMKQPGLKADSNEIVAYNRGPKIDVDSTRGSSWNYLKGTYKEANYIDSLFRKNNISSTFYSDSSATETFFKNMSGKSPQVIHVSTHGFFFPEPKENYDEFVISQSNGEKNCRFSENPLLRSGLIMAGANFVWKGGEQIPGTDDGILSAYEVSNMNLSQTKLVVLSACETGLGDISGGEGVYGLQRAFKMAGVNYIIMSLWQVPDKETVEFMQIFYNNCINKNTIRESFAAAQATMRKKYSPYYWAAFVLVE
jgi:CHAT domain-containing protein